MRYFKSYTHSNPGPGFSLRKALSISLILLLLLAPLTGCDNRAEGEQLAKAGAATAETLAKYYESLVQDALDIWELEAFNSSIRGIEFSHAAQDNLQKQIDSLNARARLARGLMSTYNALKDLSSFDASGQVKESAEGLVGAIKGLPIFPASGINPAGIFGMIAEDITKWKQSKDIRKGSELILKVLERLTELFQKESQAYKSFATERGSKFENVIDFLIQNKMVLALPLLQKVPDSLGLKLAAADKPVESPETRAALVELARVRVRRIALMSAGAADGIMQSLGQLVSNHKEFQAKRGLSLETVMAGLERARAYIDEINKLREQKSS